MVFNFYPKSIEIVESTVVAGEPATPRPLHVFEPVRPPVKAPDAAVQVNAWVELEEEAIVPDTSAPAPSKSSE